MKRKKSPPRPATSSPAKTSGQGERRSKVFIIGESPLVEGYAELCAEKGYDVVAHREGGPISPAVTGKIRDSAGIPAGTDLALELTNSDIASKQRNLQKLDKALPPTVALLSSSVTVAASEQAGWIDRKNRLVGFGALPSFVRQGLVEVAPTVHTPVETVEVARRFFASLGKDCEFVQDRVGLVMPRIICQIINEAFFALQDEVASPEDIDTAMKLGVNYPFGPIEWGYRIGFRQVYAVLTSIEGDLREDRYRVAPLLKQMAMTGEWWKSPADTHKEPS